VIHVILAKGVVVVEVSICCSHINVVIIINVTDGALSLTRGR
jgi:hypothetical protein